MLFDKKKRLSLFSYNKDFILNTCITYNIIIAIYLLL